MTNPTNHASGVAEPSPVTYETLRVGGKYNWKNQPERLVYMGMRHYVGNGNWHQFALVDKPDSVWCEVRVADLASFEETQTAALEATSGVAEPDDERALSVTEWIRNNYQDHPTIDSLCDALADAIRTPTQPAAPAEVVATDLRDVLTGAANYIDTLGGDSKKYRAALFTPAQAPASPSVGEPVAQWQIKNGGQWCNVDREPEEVFKAKLPVRALYERPLATPPAAPAATEAPITPAQAPSTGADK